MGFTSWAETMSERFGGGIIVECSRDPFELVLNTLINELSGS